MSEFITTASTFLHNISDLFSGSYKSANPEYAAMKAEMHDISVPTIEHDRKSTHRDMGQVGGDFKKSVKEYGKK